MEVFITFVLWFNLLRNMEFKKEVESVEYYKELEEYGRKVMGKRKYPLDMAEKEDIIGGVFVEILISNPDVANKEQFKKGAFAKYIINRSLAYLEKRDKMLISNDLDINIPDVKYKEMDVSCLKKLDNYPKLKAIFEDKYVNKLSFAELKKKHNIERMDKCLNEAKKIITTPEYCGIARMKDGKIEKVYHNLRATSKDGFTSYRVSACCKGERKTYKGYEWKNVKDL